LPTYDYICTQCGHKMEVVHSIHADGPTACPVCGGLMRKGFAPPNVHYKGTGWARKERSSSRPGSSSRGSSSDSGDGSSAASSGDGSSAKPSGESGEGSGGGSGDKQVTSSAPTGAESSGSSTGAANSGGQSKDTD
jgi:putative FmdB family regulatory protein